MYQPIVIRIYLFTFALIFLTTQLKSQIGGVTGTKINALNHKAIDTGSAEFEPNYSIIQSSKYWDENGEENDIYNSKDSIYWETGISFRMAYALSDKFEVGTLLANDYSNWSVKYAYLTKEKLGIGLQGGFNLPYGITVIDKTNRQADQVASYILSLSGSYEFSKLLSIDANIQYQDYFDSVDQLQNSDIFVYVDAGQYISDGGVLLMASVSYQQSKFDLFNQNKFSFYPGVAFEMKDNFFLVLNCSFDLSGKKHREDKWVCNGLDNNIVN